MVARPRFEDYKITYQNPHNMFAFMGLGFTKDQVEDGDLSPYMSKDALETKFYSFKSNAE